jgi:hypothetical protein
MADDDRWRNALVWSEKEDGSFETDVPNSLGQLRVKLIENSYFEITATVVSLDKSRDYDQAKEFTQAFIDNHPEAIDALTTLWLEANLFVQSYVLGCKSRP